MLVGTAVVATVAAAPVVAAVAIGIAIYGVLDYFFDIGDKVDAPLVGNQEYGNYEENLFDKLFPNGKDSG